MSSSVDRFSTRAENYAKYRPRYPEAVLDILRAQCQLAPAHVVADVGSGTGFSAELFLKNGNKVFGIEPNAAMRAVAERLMAEYGEFISIDGSAENTTLDDKSIDFAVAGQAFHWFDREKTRVEFARILKPEGWVVLIWNERLLDTSPFLRGYEKLLLEYGTDYNEVRHENVASAIADFFSPGSFKLETVPNTQVFDYDGLRGRVESASYTPEPGHPNFDNMMTRLEGVFREHNQGGTVNFDYKTTVYFGRLK